jgi:hypothetical protein
MTKYEWRMNVQKTNARNDFQLLDRRPNLWFRTFELRI